ncbi:MAG: ABC transporter ATP-binding protein [Verrucomicrobiales bacterium]
MVTIRVNDLSLALPPFHLREVTLEVAAGEYFVLLGPTGAGKTVLLECLVGLLRPDAGKVFLGDRDVTRLAPEHRGVGYLPQDYALFPNMTVRRNIAFGLKVRGAPGDRIRRKVAELADQLNIAHLLDRLPLKLSGGEKQRAGLARALAVEPPVLLLDEPLAAVDERSRDRIAGDLRELQQSTGVTVVHVSHNFEETLAVADRIGVVNQGRLEQVGTPEDIFERPARLAVAEFTRAKNIFPIAEAAPASGELARIALADGTVLRADRSANRGEPAHAMVRPEHVRLLPAAGNQPVPAGHNEVKAAVRRLVPKGALTGIECAAESGTAWFVLLPTREARRWQPGVPALLSFSPEDVHLLEREGLPQRV